MYVSLASMYSNYFQPPGLFLVLKGLKFQTLGGLRYIHIYIYPYIITDIYICTHINHPIKAENMGEIIAGRKSLGIPDSAMGIPARGMLAVKWLKKRMAMFPTNQKKRIRNVCLPHDPSILRFPMNLMAIPASLRI